MVVWFARPIRLQVAAGVEAGGRGAGELRQKAGGVAAALDEVADDLRLGAIEHDEESSPGMLQGLRGGGHGLFVPRLAVDDRGEPVAGVPPHVLPDVEDRPARRVDERATSLLEAEEHRHGDAECRQDDDVIGSDGVLALAGVAQEPDAGVPQPVVDPRVVDDLAGEVDGPFRETAARLVRVVDGPVDAVAEAELARQVQAQAPHRAPVIGRPHLVHQRAVVVRRQLAGDLVFQRESLAEDPGRLGCVCHGRGGAARRAGAPRRRLPGIIGWWRRRRGRAA